MKAAIFRKEHFNAAHRLYLPQWSDAQNYAVFGLCSNPRYHGHNYELEVKLVGEVNPQTGILMDLKDLKKIISEKILLEFDHKNLNEEVAEFAQMNPTAENIAYVIWHRLRPCISTEIELWVRLYETPRNFVEYWGE